MIPVVKLCEFLREQFKEASDGIVAYWLQTPTSRSALCEEILGATTDVPVLPVAVDGGEFLDPDGVMDALSQVLIRQKNWFTGVRREQIARERRLIIVLVSYRSLGLQISSPVTLPEWFPAWPGHNLMCKIHDLGSEVNSLISDPDLPIPTLRSALWSLERALRDRIGMQHEKDSRACDSLWARIKSEKLSESIDSLLADSKRAESEISDPKMFRPGASDNRFVVSRLFRLWLKASPDELHKIATSLANALGLDDTASVPREFSFAALLARPPSPKLSDTSNSVVLCRSAVTSMAHAMQLSTAAAHAADYPRFPYVLISEMREISRGLANLPRKRSLRSKFSAVSLLTRVVA